MSKRCQYLSEKIHRDKQRLDHETISIRIVQRKIHEQEHQLNHFVEKQTHLHDKLNEIKQSSTFSRSSKPREDFRRLSILINRIQKQCQEKLKKIERIFLLIGQCQRLEFDDERSSFSIESKMNFNEIISRINYLGNCRWEFDSIFDELTSFWKRVAYVQLDLSMRIKEKSSLKQRQDLLKKQLKYLF